LEIPSASVATIRHAPLYEENISTNYEHGCCLNVFIAEKVIGRKFDITEYGVCFIEDVLDDVPESVAKVSHYCIEKQMHL